MVEAFDGADEAHGAFAHQIGEGNGAAAVLQGDLQHEPHVRGNQLFARGAIPFAAQLEETMLILPVDGAGFADIFEIPLECFVCGVESHGYFRFLMPSLAESERIQQETYHSGSALELRKYSQCRSIIPLNYR